MSQFSDIAGALSTIVTAVTNVGQVHARRRWDADWSRFLNQFKATISGKVQVRAWMVTREGWAGEPGDSFGEVQRQHRMLLVGALGVEDASDTETTFQGLIESICDAIDARKDLGLSAVVDYSVGPCSVRTIGVEPVGSVLCHVCEIEIPVTTVQTVAYA